MNEIYATGQTFYDDVVNIVQVTSLTLIQISCMRHGYIFQPRYPLGMRSDKYFVKYKKYIALNSTKIVPPVIVLNKSFILPRDFPAFKAAWKLSKSTQLSLV